MFPAVRATSGLRQLSRNNLRFEVCRSSCLESSSYGQSSCLELLLSLRTASTRSSQSSREHIRSFSSSSSSLPRRTPGSYRSYSSSSSSSAPPPPPPPSSPTPPHPKSRIAIYLASGSVILLIAHNRYQAHLSSQPLLPDPDSDHVIPISSSPTEPAPSSETQNELVEELKSILSSPIRILNRWIIEPFLTVVRFLKLAFLFGPVILTSPMLLVGTPGEMRRRRRRRKAAKLGKSLTNDPKDAKNGQLSNTSVTTSSDDDEHPEERWGAVWWYGFLVKQMERAGPTFIKLGQWAASRADLFPTSLCEKMGKLHSNGKPHTFGHTKKVLEQVFEKKFEEIFDVFEEEPIGCGAIAQVYRATLKTSYLPEEFIKEHEFLAAASAEKGQPPAPADKSVAIKILHPGIQQTIRRDLAIMNIFAQVINFFPGMEWLSLPEEVQVFGQMMNSQLDLRVEANNLDKFQYNFRHRGPGVTFPRPIRIDKVQKDEERKKITAEVLVEEFEDALPLKYFLKNGGGEYDDRIANIGLDAFLNMLLIDNWTHGDLHPGNIMVRFYKPSTKDYVQHLLSSLFSTPEPADPIFSADSTELVHKLAALAHDKERWLDELDDLAKKGYEPELIFIDAGLVTNLDTNNRRNFLDLFKAVAEFDGYKAGELMVERCRTPELAIDKETFALKVQHLVLSVKSKTFSLAAIKISDILTEVLTAIREHHVKMEGDFVNTVISILLLEGIGRQLDPNMDLFKSALPILRQLGRQMGTKEAISQVPSGNIWAMAKIWVWLEAREIAGSSTNANIDEWIKLDRLTPNI